MPRPRTISAKNRPFKHIELSDGDWINLKQSLDYGEASELYDATYRSGVSGPSRGTQREVRMSEFNLQRISLYTLAWSFVDDEMKPLPLSTDSIRRLDTDTAEEIHAAITALEAENERVEQASKKVAAEPTATVNTSAGSSQARQGTTSQSDKSA